MTAQIFRSKAEWQVLLASWLGMLFDGMDASIFVLALFPTLSDLMHTKSHGEIAITASYILATFMVGWTVGGMAFGVLADKIGRVNTMILTILLFAIATGLCATSQNTIQLGFYRFLVGCGIGGEVSVSGVLLAECWKGKDRYWATGIMCTAFGTGYLGTAVLNAMLGDFGWRTLYVAGMIPALLTIYIRLKLKESPQYLAAASNKVSGAKSEPVGKKLSALLAPAYIKKISVVLTLASTSIVGYWAVLSWIPAWINQLTGTTATAERSLAAIVLNVGSIFGAAFLGFAFDKLGRKQAFAYSFVGALISCIGMFMTVKTFGPALLCWVFSVGLFATAPFVPLFIYVPELFPVNLRATAFGVSVQTGRLFAATAAIIAGKIISVMGGSYAIAGSCVALVYLVGAATCLFLPRSSGEVMPIDAPLDLPERQLAEVA
jgi:MFS family permease